jgi:dTMP kinase
MARGAFIAIEGIDGSGKHTQSEMLGRVFTARGIPWVPVSFPRYETAFGKLIASFLNGEFGSLEAVDAHLSALLYAGNRFEAKTELEQALAAGKTILADRYVASNLAHQTARVPPDRREQFIAWLRLLEYGTYGLPTEDLVIYLRMGASEAQRLVGKKAPREYTSLGHDLQESDLTHLEKAAMVFDRLAADPSWITIECFDGSLSRVKPVDEIHKAVLAAVDSRGVLPLPVSRVAS